MRKLVRLIGSLILIGLGGIGWLMYSEAPLPQSLIDIEVATGLTKRGLLIGDGFAIVHGIGKLRPSYDRYVPAIDDYQWGEGGHYDYVPDNTVIQVGAYIDGRTYTCFNGRSVLFDSPRFLTPITAAEIASMQDISENHANDTCRLVIGKQYRATQDASWHWNKGGFQ